MNETSPTSFDTTAPATHGFAWRWLAMIIGLFTGLADAFLLSGMFGIVFQVNGQDATLLVGAYFGVSFAVLGYCLGAVIEARRRDRRMAGLIRAQNETINATRSRLLQSEKLAALGQLAAAIAHEVRNPLGIIRSAAQGIAESLRDPQADAQRACSFITAETDRLNNVVNSLLAFVRPIKTEPRRATVRELFDTALLLAENDFGAKQIRVRRYDPDGLPAFHADRDLIVQVLVDLLNNAAAATPPGGEVVLEAESSNDSIEIAVADSGPGVPSDLRGRIFEPFFTTRSGGTGLGLAIARQIVDAHGGRIEVGERSGGGARFAISLPMMPVAALAA